MTSDTFILAFPGALVAFFIVGCSIYQLLRWRLDYDRRHEVQKACRELSNEACKAYYASARAHADVIERLGSASLYVPGTAELSGHRNELAKIRLFGGMRPGASLQAILAAKPEQLSSSVEKAIRDLALMGRVCQSVVQKLPVNEHAELRLLVSSLADRSESARSKLGEARVAINELKQFISRQDKIDIRPFLKRIRMAGS